MKFISVTPDTPAPWWEQILPQSVESAWVVVPLVILLVVQIILRSPRVKGALGERRVARALKAADPTGTAKAMHDVTLRVQGRTTQIDHVLIAPQGVFVIETKNMAGAIYGTARDRRWTQAIGGKTHSFQNPVHQNYGHVKAIEAHLGLGVGQAHSLIVFVGRARPRTLTPVEVVWGTAALKRALRQTRPVLFTAAQIEALAARLQAARLAPGRATQRAHIKSIKAARP